MKKMTLFFLFCAFSLKAWPLVPIEGIIYGKVADIKQYDPFAGMLNYEFTGKHNKDKSQVDNLINYFALYKQGNALDNKCSYLTGGTYANLWKEETAIRSVMATLQYIGLDIALKAIVEYAKKLNYEDEKFSLLYENLVTNTCSENISVYSKKLLRSNFQHYWKNNTGFLIPNIKQSSFYNEKIKKFHDTRETTLKEFEYSLRSFRSFCSWNGDKNHTDFIGPYLRNPYIMSFIFNTLLKQKIAVDIKTKEVYLERAEKGIQVACENMICRRRNQVDFKRLFPLMNGSTKLSDDLNGIYCSKFKNAIRLNPKLTKKTRMWKEADSRFSRYLETMHFLSLMTHVPDMALMSSSFKDLTGFFQDNIKSRWDNWAEEKSNQFNMEQLYEESLEITLVSQKNTNEIEKGNFNIKFDIEMGEMDKVLNGFDKISSKFYLKFPAQYFKSLKKQIPFYYNSNRLNKLKLVENKLLQLVNLQLEEKKKYFKVPIWNDAMGSLIARELLAQINNTQDFRLNDLSKTFIKIPVAFHYGIFALQYIRKKQVFKSRNKNIVSFR